MGRARSAAARRAGGRPQPRRDRRAGRARRRDPRRAASPWCSSSTTCRLVMGLCDRISVLDFGRKIAEGTADEVRRDPLVIDGVPGEERRVLVCEDLHAGYGRVPVLHGVSLTVAAGRAGGPHRPERRGQDDDAQDDRRPAAPGPGHRRLRRRVARRPRSRRRRGARASRSCRRGAWCSSRSRCARTCGSAPTAREPGRRRARASSRCSRRFPRSRDRLGQLGGTLSGGQQQMLAIGAGAHVESGAAAAGRALDRPRADHRRIDLPTRCATCTGGAR